ncbi:MAG: hypothetical protein QMD14_03725 [Candidatus Aenigmarchaeota archaeon]|nr:hypothetical protein [Candidatus Aenigmarchaeota archaeon]
MEPPLVKTLKLLRDAKESLKEREIADRTKEKQDNINKALEKLVERNIVTKNGELYSYCATDQNEEFTQKMFAVYDQVIKKPRMELIVRGLLSYQLPYSYLFPTKTLLKILENEGFDPRESITFLREEMKSGWISELEVHIGSKEKFYSPFGIRPSYTQRVVVDKAHEKEQPHAEVRVIYHGKIPPEFFTHISELRHINSLEEYEEFKKEFKKRWEDAGWFTREEYFLIGMYPQELTNPAREYLNKEKKEIINKLTDEGFRLWFHGRPYIKI